MLHILNFYVPRVIIAHPFVRSYCLTYRCRFRQGGGGRGGAAEKRGVEEGADTEAWEIVVVSRYVPQITYWIALAAIKWVIYGH